MDWIEAVDAPAQEVKLRKGVRRSIDLAAKVTLADGSPGCLAVEVKVDSAWSLKQLQEMTPEDAHGVLFALGRTALMASPSDLRFLSDARRRGCAPDGGCSRTWGCARYRRSGRCWVS